MTSRSPITARATIAALSALALALTLALVASLRTGPGPSVAGADVCVTRRAPIVAADMTRDPFHNHAIREAIERGRDVRCLYSWD